MAERCFQAACMGKELTMWDQIQVMFWFFGPVAIILFIMIMVFMWLVKK